MTTKQEVEKSIDAHFKTIEEYKVKAEMRPNIFTSLGMIRRELHDIGVQNKDLDNMFYQYGQLNGIYKKALAQYISLKDDDRKKQIADISKRQNLIIEQYAKASQKLLISNSPMVDLKVIERIYKLIPRIKNPQFPLEAHQAMTLILNDLKNSGLDVKVLVDIMRVYLMNFNQDRNHSNLPMLREKYLQGLRLLLNLDEQYKIKAE